MKIIYLIMISLSILNADFVRSDSNNTVIDTIHNLEWQDDSSMGSQMPMHWEDAIGHCESLSLDGSGWRLPNISELKSSLDYTQYPIIPSPFVQITNSYYWSSTSYSLTDAKNNAWYVHLYTGAIYYDEKRLNSAVRCVRDEE
ncbi:MAG: DUF1566 domain-containing protein [Campylobacterota bacterium]